MESKGRVIWISSSPFVGDACGKQSHYVCKGLAEAGYSVEFLAWNWSGVATGYVYDVDGLPVFAPFDSKCNGTKLYRLSSLNRMLYENLLRAQVTKAVVTLGDFQLVVPLGAIASKTNPNVKWYDWFPIDFIEWDMSVAKLFYETDCNLVTMSDFGYKMAVDNFYQPVANIYHGVDTNIFKPSTDSKAAVRKRLNLPESTFNNFVIGFVGQNMERKRLDKLMEAFSMFAKNKNNVTLLAHTDPYQNEKVNASYPLTELIAKDGLDTKVFHTHPVNYSMKYSDATMADLYNAMNVQLLPSSGEGFGVPVLEGNACGTPCIMTHATTAEQLVGRGQGFMADVSSTYLFNGFRRAMVNAESITNILNTIYSNPSLLVQASGLAALDAKKYDFKIIQEKWIDLIK